MVRIILVLSCAISAVGGASATTAAYAAGTNFTVDTTADVADGSCGDGSCSLRDAITEANALGGGQQANITLPPGHYYLNADSLGANEDSNVSDDLDITADVTVVLHAAEGHGAGDTVIFGTDQATPGFRHRILDVAGAASLSIRDIALVDGWMPTANGAAIMFRSSGELHLDRAYIGGNVAQYGGALALVSAIAPDEITISDSQFENNTSTEAGGAIYVSQRHAVIQRTTLRNNTAHSSTAGGGAIFTEGPSELEVESTLLYDNQTAGPGAAIANYGPATLVLENSTVVSNDSDTDDLSADPLGAVYLRFNGSTYTSRANLFANNTHLVAGDPQKLSCSLLPSVSFHTATSLGGNRQDDAAGDCVTPHATDSMSLSSDQLGLGSIQSHTADVEDGYSLRPGFLPILPTSSAIDAADADLCRFTGDIRGAARSAGTSCDAGAYEFGSRTDAGVSSAVTTAEPRAGASITMRASITATGAEGLPHMTTITTLSAGVTATAATVPGGTCAIAATVRCIHPVLAAGAQSDATITLTAAAGSYSLQTTHNYHPGDTNSSNETVNVPLEVAAALRATDPPATGTPPTSTNPTSANPATSTAPRPVLGPYPRFVKHVRGRVALKVACPAGVTPRCQLRGSLRSMSKVRGAFITAKCTPLNLAAGRTGTLVCMITAKHRAHFTGRAGLRMVLTVTGRSSAPQAVTVKRAVTIRG